MGYVYLMPLNVLVTGAAGFIGSNLVNRCLNEGFNVTGVDDLSNGHLEFLPRESKLIVNDFSSKRILANIVKGHYDVVMHLAAVPRVSYSVEHPIETNDINVSRTLKLIDTCRGNVKRIVFASSSSVYGGADVSLGPTNERDLKNPRSPYALQKSMIEDYLSLYGDVYGLDSISLRFFNVFGPHCLGVSPYTTAVSSWLTAIKQGRPMRSDGTGEQSRDLCYVDNVTDAVVRAATVEGTFKGQKFNVACGERTTNNEIMQFLLKRYPDAKKVDAPWRAGDVLHTHADIRSACEVLGYEPKVKVWEGIERTIDWYEASWSWIKDMKQSV